MLRSMYSAISGLSSHQTRMDVIGNNIANVNTTGFKKSRATFQDLFSQTLQGASSASDQRGGTNPQQVGLGVQLGAVSTIQDQGGFQLTNRSTDLAIDGNGFFVVSSGNNSFYTRAGAFEVDEQGYLVTPDGYQVNGYQADDAGNISDSATVAPIRIPTSETLEPEATTNITFDGNLSAEEVGNTGYSTSILVDAYDSLGRVQRAEIEFSNGRQGYNASGNLVYEWDWSTGASATGSGIVRFDSSGNFAGFYDTVSGTVAVNGATTDIPDGNYSVQEVGPSDHRLKASNGTVLATSTDGGVTYTASTGEADDTITFGTPVTSGTVTVTAGNAVGTGSSVDPASINIDPGDSEPITAGLDFSRVTQVSGETNIGQNDLDGRQSGDLDTFQIGSDGVISASFTNGQRRDLGQVVLGTFTNPAGLSKAGDSVFQASNNSGDVRISKPDQGGAGAIKGGYLEMSNVDLSQEFTDMITTQRGFQANARVTTTSDTILEELVNLKR